MEEISISKLISKKIDGILKSPRYNARRLADMYLSNHHDIFPIPSGKKFLNICNGVEMGINKKTLNDLKNNYNQETIRKIFWALVVWEEWLTKKSYLAESIREINEDKAKSIRYFSQRHSKNIRAAEVLLTETSLNEMERKVISTIKTRQEGYLKSLSQYQNQSVTLDPLKEKQLEYGIDEYLSALPNFNPYSNVELQKKNDLKNKWQLEYLLAMGGIVFKKPNSRPKKTIEKALLIVIFNLLKEKGNRTNWLYSLTSDIVGQFFKKKISAKDIDNALHSS